MKSPHPHSREPQPYNMTTLAALYGVDRKTLRTWMKPFTDYIGKRRGQFFTKGQVKRIFEKIEPPYSLDKE